MSASCNIDRLQPQLGPAEHISHSHLQRRLFQNSRVIFLCRAIAMGSSLVSVPVVIRVVGFGGYGVWESLFAISVLAAIPQNILGGTLLWKMSIAFGADNTQEIDRLARIGIAITLGYTSLAVPLMLLIRHAAVRALHVPAVYVSAAEIILPAIMMVILLGGINESFASIMRGCQHASWSTAIPTAATVLNAAVTIICLRKGLGLYSLLSGFVSAFVVAVPANLFFARKFCAGLSFIPALPRMEDLRSSRKYAACLLLGSASSSLRTETDKIVLAVFGSPLWVGYYAIAARLAGVVMDTSNFFCVPTIAAVGALSGRGDQAAIKKLYARLMLVIPLVTGAAVAMVAGSAREIMIFWLRTYEPKVIPILLLLLCGTGSAVLLTGPGTCVCKGIGRIEIESMYVGACLILNVVLTIALVWAIGVMGTVIATAVSWAVGALYFVYIFHRKLKFPSKVSLGALKCLLTIVPVVILHHWVVPHMLPGASRLSVFVALAVNSMTLLAIYFPAMILVGVVPFRNSRPVFAWFSILRA
jgi:O-antigen/teichoic acid export membrane protein